MSALRRHGAGIAVLVLGLVFLLVGIMRGEASVVLTKAINLCLECIGIG